MTKKHYEAIAAIMQKYAHHPDWIPEKLADYFASDNPKFNRVRFLEACGIESPAINYHHGAQYIDCATIEQLQDLSSRHYKGCHACGYTER